MPLIDLHDDRYWSMGEIILAAGLFHQPPDSIYARLMDLDFYMEMRRRADTYKIKPWVFNCCLVASVRKAIVENI
jgi:hypothetical protein